jgi:diguanylate cyclase (GGDEF)-like protein/PAS domain S-box-containing protein
MAQEPSYEQLQHRVRELEQEQQKRRRIEEELLKRQRYLESVLHHAPDAIVTLDASHRVLEWNPGAERIFGYSKEEALGRDLDDLVSSADVVEEAKDNTRHVLSGRSIPPVETIRYTKNGAAVPVIASGAPILMDGTLEGVVAVYTDISEQKRAECALEESERVYRALFENTGAATVIIEEDTTISLANREFERLTGHSRQEIEGRKSWKDFIASAQDREMMEEYHRLRRIDPFAAPNKYECRFLGRDGEVKEMVITVDMIPGSRQSVASFLDVSRYKQLQESLKQERDSLENILENSADAIAIVDEEGRFTRWNKSAAEQFGYGFEEIRSKRDRDLYADAAEMEAMRYRLRMDGYIRNYEIAYERKDGTRVPASVSVKLLKDTNGEPIGSVSIIRDLSEWKKAEERLNFMSFHDSLTGLYNRNFFEEEMRRLQDGRYAPVGIIICDLDGMKFINDTLGHKSGDEMLCSTAAMLRQSFRSSDIIARIGGDEFAVLVTGTDEEATGKLVARLKRTIEEYNANAPKIPLFMSLGYAVSSSNPLDMEDLFREADNRMYRDKMQKERSTRSYSLQALTKALEARDFITQGHNDRLQELVVSLAHSLGLSEGSINDLCLLARFHDLGKLGIPDNILFKPGPLNGQEFAEMQKHCEIGQRIAQSMPLLAPIEEWVLKHHERWDGKGYPLGLKGEEIPLSCRILAIADAYDAMVSDRPYRKAMPVEMAIRELLANAGTQFDPELVEAFIAMISDESSHEDAEG